MIAFIVIVLCVVVGAFGQSSRVDCSKANACEPWDLLQGPYCSRGNNINLRFGVDLAPENGYNRYQQFNTEGTYAACMVVDELSAVNLTNAGKFIGTIADFNTTSASADPNTGSVNTFTQHGTSSWLSVYGFGGNDNIAFPNRETSAGTVMVFKNDTSICEEGKFPFVDFLILKVSLSKGKFAYTSDSNQPTGVGFDNTCSGGSCTLDGGLKCIGEYGNENCAKCLSADEMADAGIQVWLSYGGTDRSNKPLLSFSQNPLNYRQYAGSSVYSQISESVNGVSNGEFTRKDPLVPT